MCMFENSLSSIFLTFATTVFLAVKPIFTQIIRFIFLTLFYINLGVLILMKFVGKIKRAKCATAFFATCEAIMMVTVVLMFCV